MKDNLLKEAIEDAKLVKETAIAQAKQSLEEAFAPQLSALLSKQLRTEANLQDTSDVGDTEVTVKDPGPKEPSKHAWDSSDVGNDGLKGAETEPYGKGGAGSESIIERQKMGDTGMGEPLVDHEMPGMEDGFGDGEDMNVDVHPDMHGGEDFDMSLEPEEDGLDLEAIIRELEKDLHEPEDGVHQGNPAWDDIENRPAQHSDSEHQPEDMLPEDWDDPMAGKKVDGWKTSDEYKRGWKHENKNTNKNKKKVNEVTPDPAPNYGKEVKPGEEVEEGLEVISRDRWGEAGEEVKPGEEVTENTDLDEVLREMEADEHSSMDESEKIAAENVKLKESLKEHRQVVQYLRDKLQEINLLNSKLLFTNKVFKQHSLNGKQKMRVVEQFDRATTLREVKLVYATLCESLEKKPTKTTKSITEGMASKATGGNTKQKTEILTEGDAVYNRFQVLAGIKKQVL